MGFYEDIAATANDVLAEFGAPVVLTRQQPATYDPSAGTTTAPKAKKYTGVAVAANYTDQDMRNSLIQQGDQKLYIGTAGMVSPQPGDTVTMGGATYTVVSSKPLAPALVPVLFECQIRGLNAS